MHLSALLGVFTDRSDSFPYPFIYFNKWNSYPFLYLKPEKGSPFPESPRIGLYREYPPPPSLPLYAIIGSTPPPSLLLYTIIGSTPPTVELLTCYSGIPCTSTETWGRKSGREVPAGDKSLQILAYPWVYEDAQ